MGNTYAIVRRRDSLTLFTGLTAVVGFFWFMFAVFGATGTAGPFPGIFWFLLGCTAYQLVMYTAAKCRVR